jgi:hypothetical protein
MSDNDVEELLNAIDKHTNAIRAELRTVDQGDSTTTDPGDSAKTDQVDKEFLGTRDLEALTGTKAGTWRYWGEHRPGSGQLQARQAPGLENVGRTGVACRAREKGQMKHPDTNGHNKIGGMNDGAAVMTRPAAEQAVSATRGVRRIRLPCRRLASTEQALQVS